jgi:hypothetical protein
MLLRDWIHRRFGALLEPSSLFLKNGCVGDVALAFSNKQQEHRNMGILSVGAF